MASELLLSHAGRRGVVLDPRTKLLLAFTMGTVLLGGGYGGLMDAARPVLVVLPFALLLSARSWGMAVFYAVAYAGAWALQTFAFPYAHGALNFLLVILCMFFLRFWPCIVGCFYVFSTTTVSEFIAAMERMRAPEAITIPLAVMFRFFPTVKEEYASIRDAMRMRGISLGGGRPLAMLEYRLVPTMACCVRIGEELSASALTRGLGAPVRRTNVCSIGFSWADAVVAAVCLACFAAFAAWYVAGRLV